MTGDESARRRGSSSTDGEARAEVLACVGDNCVDYYLAPIDRRFAAGNAVNVAVGLRRAGFAVDYFGAVGDDPAGRQIVAALREIGVGVDYVQRLLGPTSLTEIRLDAGERRFAGFIEGAAEKYVPSRADLAELRRRRLVHAVNLPASGDVLFSALRNSGVALSCDFDDARVMTAANGLAVAFFSASDEEPLGDARLLAQAAVERGAEAAVVMCGARGSVGCDHDQVVALEAAAIEPLDTCGAGDSYIAAFLGARLGGRDLESCMRVARGAATATCLSLSALPINDGAPNRSKDKTSTKPGVREVR